LATIRDWNAFQPGPRLSNEAAPVQDARTSIQVDVVMFRSPSLNKL
jgi:hypothetical protein